MTEWSNRADPDGSRRIDAPIDALRAPHPEAVGAAGQAPIFGIRSSRRPSCRARDPARSRRYSRAVALIGIDVLTHLRRQAHTVPSLASVLSVSEDETKAMLDVLVREELVSLGSAGYGAEPSSFVAQYTISPECELMYGKILNRWPAPIMGPPSMSAFDRFIAALGHDATVGLRNALFGLLEALPLAADDVLRQRAYALGLARSASGWAQRALDADVTGSATSSAGMRSLRPMNESQMAHAAEVMRTSYLEHIDRPDLREVVAEAASAFEATWDLRLLGPRSADGISERREPDPDAVLAVADHAAFTLRALARALGVDVVHEARTAVGLTTDLR